MGMGVEEQEEVENEMLLVGADCCLESLFVIDCPLLLGKDSVPLGQNDFRLMDVTEHRRIPFVLGIGIGYCLFPLHSNNSSGCLKKHFHVGCDGTGTCVCYN